MTRVLVEAFMQVSSFDLVPTDAFFDEVVGVPHSDPLSPNFEGLGYESLSVMRNMGLIFFLLLWCLLAGLVAILLHRFR